VSERHRHRYEVNNHYRALLEKGGLVFSGVNEELNLVEMAELPTHPWFLGCQFHPEFRSKPFEPHPLFIGFVRAALEYRKAHDTAARKASAAGRGMTAAPAAGLRRRPRAPEVSI
jgi:CTP synthase